MKDVAAGAAVEFELVDLEVSARQQRLVGIADLKVQQIALRRISWPLPAFVAVFELHFDLVA